eukprot:2975583-Prymnesium_polylepis.1
MVGSHHGQAASCEGVSKQGGWGQERVARAVVGSEGGGGRTRSFLLGHVSYRTGAVPHARA